MKALWWFEENLIAGMARPGFNGTRWFEFSFQEGVLVGWLGQMASGAGSLADFQSHVQSYGAKIHKFYHLDSQSAEQALQIFSEREGILSVLKSVSLRSDLLDNYDVSASHVHFEFSKKRLHWEIDSLKNLGIRKIISLTEAHHSKNQLREQFESIHFSINDLDAPKLEQVLELAEVVREAKANKEKIAVHCLAGIGRTSTMLIGAYMVLGESLESLKAKIARQNPVFVFAGKQTEFLHALAAKL